MDRMEAGTAAALAGAAVYSIHAIYTQHAGTLHNARNAAPGDPDVWRRLTDADILTGALVLIAGGLLTIATKRGEPLAISVGAFAVTAAYYHAAANGEA